MDNAYHHTPEEVTAQMTRFVKNPLEHLGLESGQSKEGYVTPEGEGEPKQIKVARTAGHYLVTGTVEDGVLVYNVENKALEVGTDEGELRPPTQKEIFETAQSLRNMGPYPSRYDEVAGVNKSSAIWPGND